METFTLKVKGQNGPEWLKAHGKVVTITRRKVLRTFLRNRRLKWEPDATIYLNGQPFKFEPQPQHCA